MDAGQQWMDAMRSGDFALAWQISDRHLAKRRGSAGCKHQGPRHQQQIWRGEPLKDARVLVRCYHGLGDTIQFIRFAAPLRRIAREVIVWCQPELLNLVRGAEGVDHVLPLHDGAPDVDFDVDIEIMELPHALRIAPSDLALESPYLRAPSSLRVKRSDQFYVGVVWEAGGWDDRRSVPRAFIEALAHIPNVRLVSLRPEADLQGTCLTDWSSPSIDVLACRMSALDLIVTVDTMAAHLAGALALPTWVILHHDADWRWGTSEHSAWYPTLRLFRQTQTNDWSQPLRSITTELQCRSPVRVRTQER